MLYFVKKSILVIAFCLMGPSLWAQSYSFNGSLTWGYDMISNNLYAYDMTFFINQYGAVRYSTIRNVLFDHGREVIHSPSEISIYKVEGDFETTFLLKTLDYRSFSGPNKGPFDFLTAYAGAGYNYMKAEIIEDHFEIINNQLTHEVNKEETRFPVSSSIFGLMGQEKFIVLDARLLYYRGQIPKKGILGKDIDFQHFGIIISIGFGI